VLVLVVLQCNMKTIARNTEVVSISLSKEVVSKLDLLTKSRGQSKSALIASLINQINEDDRWQKLYKKGEKTAKQFKITSEDDIDRILHEA